MPPCTRPHCPSYKHSCQHQTCTRALRNRLERHRSERDHLQTNLELETTTAMRTLRKLRENCSNKLSRDLLSRVKREFEEQISRRVERLRCFCAECAVEHKEREISALRRNFERLEVVRRAVVLVQQRKARAAAPPAWNQHVRHVAGQPKGVEVMGMRMMESLPVECLVERSVVVERMVFPGRVRR